MKRLILLVGLIVIFLGVATVNITYAQDSDKKQTQQRLRDGSGKDNPNEQQIRDRLREQIERNKQGDIEHGPGFVDENGDGYNDNAPDDDGDGIPNGLDPDYHGSKMHRGKGDKGYVDMDGDGMNDNRACNNIKMKRGVRTGHRPGYGKSHRAGLKDGSGNGPAIDYGSGDGNGAGERRAGRKSFGK